MKEKLQKIREEAIHQIESSGELGKLNDVRVAFLGKKGELTAVLKGMKDVAPEDRPLVGQLVNETKASIHFNDVFILFLLLSTLYCVLFFPTTGSMSFQLPCSLKLS